MSAKPASGQNLRDVIAQGAIGLMVCMGAHMFLVDPVAKKLGAAKAKEASIASQAGAAQGLQKVEPLITAACKKAREEADRIRQTGRLASHEQELFAALSMLATRHNIRVDQMTPHKLTALAKTPGGSAAPTAGSDGVSGVAYTIDASANYSDLAEFLRSLRTELGYSVIKGVRISPGMETRQKVVHAFIETEHYAFTVLPPETGPTAAAGEEN